MRPKERRKSGQNDPFRARLDQIVDMGHTLGEARPRDRLAVSRDVKRYISSERTGRSNVKWRFRNGVDRVRHERVVMFERATWACGRTGRSNVKWGLRNRVDRVDGTLSSLRPRLNSHDVPRR